MTVRLVGEEAQSALGAGGFSDILPDRETMPAQPVKPPPPIRDLTELQAQIARIMGFRLQLLLGFLGAAGLSGYSVYDHSTPSMVAAGVYDLLVFLPLLFTAYRRG